MMRFLIPLTFLLAACQGDETTSGYANPNAVYVLQEIDGRPFNARATLSFPEEGRIAGQGPCNSYRAEQRQPYPWFKVDVVASTKMACPDLKAEQTYFDALRAMTLVEVSGTVLILSNDDTGRMVFEAGT